MSYTKYNKKLYILYTYIHTYLPTNKKMCLTYKFAHVKNKIFIVQGSPVSFSDELRTERQTTIKKNISFFKMTWKVLCCQALYTFELMIHPSSYAVLVNVMTRSKQAYNKKYGGNSIMKRMCPLKHLQHNINELLIFFSCFILENESFWENLSRA